MAATTSTVIIEIRAAEGGADAKLLVEEQLAIYIRLAGRQGRPGGPGQGSL
ncbi:MAG: hypothetical protein ABI867_27340 [Kofleriaceae bacterium]